MALSSGTFLGPYEIISSLGAGGTGEVYRAKDKRLDRQVAIKVLPSSLSTNHKALSRFEREAKALAALSHPNILSIYYFKMPCSRRVAAIRKPHELWGFIQTICAASAKAWFKRISHPLDEWLPSIGLYFASLR